MSLTEFLRARLDEDERHARKLAESDRRPVLSLATTVNHPERLLLEVEAKRRIVKRMASWISTASYHAITEREQVQANRLANDTLSDLALPYADHDDYDESWRPTDPSEA